MPIKSRITVVFLPIVSQDGQRLMEDGGRLIIVAKHR